MSGAGDVNSNYPMIRPNVLGWNALGAARFYTVRAIPSLPRYFRVSARNLRKEFSRDRCLCGEPLPGLRVEQVDVLRQRNDAHRLARTGTNAITEKTDKLLLPMPDVDLVLGAGWLDDDNLYGDAFGSNDQVLGSHSE